MNRQRQPLVWLLLVCLLVTLVPSGRAGGTTTFTLMNACSYTVWPGIQAAAQKLTPAAGGLALAPGQSTVLNMPSGWSGRLWGRTGCSFDKTGKGSCATGDCGGVLQCGGAGGSPPVTLAEFTLGAIDFYDVSLVDGYNLPMTITSAGGTGGCAMAGCAVELNNACPRRLQMSNGGQIVACRSACDAFSSPRYCCTGAFGSPSTCSPSYYSRFFKSACPAAYSYAYDDPSSTFTCNGAPGYAITFCSRKSN